jgi:hypothetical protein
MLSSGGAVVALPEAVARTAAAPMSAERPMVDPPCRYFAGHRARFRGCPGEFRQS